MECSKDNYGILISDHKAQLKREIVIVFFLTIVLHVYVFSAAIILFSIEHCLYTTHQIVTEENRMSIEKCDLVNVLYNKTVIDIYAVNISDNCNATYSLVQNTCEFSEENIVKWMGFIIALCYTVGYGTIGPVTSIGKIVCMIITVPGMTITITLYSKAGTIWILVGNVMIFYTEIKLRNRDAVYHLFSKSISFRMFLLLCIVLLQTFISTCKETQDFKFLDSLFFKIAFVTTIGFGDDTPNLTDYTRKPLLLVASIITMSGAYGLFASIVINVYSKMDIKGSNVPAEQTKSRNRIHSSQLCGRRPTQHTKPKSPSQRQWEITHGLPKERGSHLTPYLAYANAFYDDCSTLKHASPGFKS